MSRESDEKNQYKIIVFLFGFKLGREDSYIDLQIGKKRVFASKFISGIHSEIISSRRKFVSLFDRKLGYFSTSCPGVFYPRKCLS